MFFFHYIVKAMSFPFLPACHIACPPPPWETEENGGGICRQRLDGRITVPPLPLQNPKMGNGQYRPSTAATKTLSQPHQFTTYYHAYTVMFHVFIFIFTLFIWVDWGSMMNYDWEDRDGYFHYYLLRSLLMPFKRLWLDERFLFAVVMTTPMPAYAMPREKWNACHYMQRIYAIMQYAAAACACEAKRLYMRRRVMSERAKEHACRLFYAQRVRSSPYAFPEARAPSRFLLRWWVTPFSAQRKSTSRLPTPMPRFLIASKGIRRLLLFCCCCPAASPSLVRGADELSWVFSISPFCAVYIAAAVILFLYACLMH